jgi:FkbM family methyltransferase
MAAEHDIDELVRAKFFANRRAGVLVEVGAAGPDFLSIGASYRASDWKVISIEPNPHFCEAHRARGNDVLQYAASDTESDNEPFELVHFTDNKYLGGDVSYESFSSLGRRGAHASSFETVRHKATLTTVPVKVRKLDTILAMHHPEIEKVDMLAVDVEGWELNVMRGFNIDHYQPDVVILENFGTEPEYTAHMREHGYKLWLRQEPNEIYIRHGKLRRLVAKIGQLVR